MRYVGIDPGLSGALALLDVGEHGLIRWALYDMPTVKMRTHRVLDVAELASLLMREVKGCANTTIVVEKVSAAPIAGRRQGTVSMFRFGESFGIVQGVLTGLQLPYCLVAPQSWKSKLLSDMPREKGSSVLVAKRLYPECAESLKRVKDHNRSDALLLAHFGRVYVVTPKLELPHDSVGVALPF